MFRSIPTTVANRIRRNYTDDSEFTKSRSEYSDHLTNTGYNSASINKAFNNAEHLSQETLVQKTKDKQLKATAELFNDNSSNRGNRISSFTASYRPVIKDQKLIFLPEAYQVRSVSLYHVVENSGARIAVF